MARLQRLCHGVEKNWWRAPLNSALHEGCVESGSDIMTGGNGAFPNFYFKDRGMVDTGDCFTAIKKLVFEDKKLTLAELIDTLDSDFQGDRGQRIREMCLQAPKYGNDVDEADYMVRDVARYTASIIKSEKNPYGWPYSISRNGVAWHYSAGKTIGALPNGRPAKQPLADGSLSPMQGMDANGPTAVLQSALKADYDEAATAILNLKFSGAFARSPETLHKIEALTDTFMRSGGLHIQYNFLDRATLVDAQQHPERYKQLVVRVAGYSAYFVTLTKEVQDEIIRRTEQSV